MDLLDRADVDVIPIDYGVDRFLNDETFIQQIFVTSEPFYVRQHGVEPAYLMLSESGFDPERVIYTNRNFARRNPEVVRRFVEASLEGWTSYLQDDRSEADAMILAQNQRMTPELIAFGVSQMNSENIVHGDPAEGESLGLIDPTHLRETVQTMFELEMISEVIPVEQIIDYSILPAAVRGDRPDEAPANGESDGAGYAETGGEDPLPGVLEITFLDAAGEVLSTQSITQADLMSLDPQTGPQRIHVLEGTFETTFLPLEALVGAYGTLDAEDRILVNCGDGYQSNYSAEQLDTNRPYLVVAVEGEPYNEYVAANAQARFGPYYANIESEEGLLDPSNKMPFGVTEIIVAPEAWLLAELSAPDTSESLAHGREIFVNNCASCHATTSGRFGGVLSNRNTAVLATHAKYNEPYFRNMLIDPVGTNPTAELMPSHPHYGDADFDAITSFMAGLAP